jgi:hypothetical protein
LPPFQGTPRERALSVRCRANMARVTQSRPDFGLDEASVSPTSTCKVKLFHPAVTSLPSGREYCRYWTGVCIDIVYVHIYVYIYLHIHIYIYIKDGRY